MKYINQIIFLNIINKSIHLVWLIEEKVKIILKFIFINILKVEIYEESKIIK